MRGLIVNILVGRLPGWMLYMKHRLQGAQPHKGQEVPSGPRPHGALKYERFLVEAMSYYYDDRVFKTYYGVVPKMRDHTFRICVDHLRRLPHRPVVVELGAARSFVDGRFPGVTSGDTTFWDPLKPEQWDWSAGLFSRVLAEELGDGVEQYTVDIVDAHLDISRTILGDLGGHVKFVLSDSVDFLRNFQSKIDLLYLDTGGMKQETAELQLREARAVVERELINPGGLILIDDVRNPAPFLSKDRRASRLGKAKYSIPYLLKSGFERVADEYQVILRKV